MTVNVHGGEQVEIERLEAENESLQLAEFYGLGQIRALQAEITRLNAVLDRLGDDEWFTEFIPRALGMAEATSNSYEAEIDARIEYARNRGVDE